MSGKSPSRHIGTSVSPAAHSHLQAGPKLGNQFLEDTFLQAVLARVLGPKLTAESKAELTRLGARAAGDMLVNSRLLNTPENQPRLSHYDAWGKRVDVIETHPAWRHMHAVAAEEGVITEGYKSDDSCRVLQFAKLHLFTPSSGLYSCPLAMTDGAVHLLKMFLRIDVSTIQAESCLQYFNDKPPATTVRLAREAVSRLQSRDPALMWTSGQWMTERGGGSDVAAGTQTVARPLGDGTYALFGYKWFTSATDANISLTLARIEDADGNTTDGSSGLSCFLLRVRTEDGDLNGIRVSRLKNKLGTKQLPTAEMELVGTVAHLVSKPGKGVACIANGMVNVTRLYNASSAASSIRRMVALARDYSHRRVVFGQPLASLPLHIRTLAWMEVNYRACLCLSTDLAMLVGLTQTWKGPSSARCPLPGAAARLTVDEAANVVRILTPVSKAYTARLSMDCMSEGLEMFGGQGYIEDTGLPAMFRDAQVATIWEGTTNVQSADFVRALVRSQGQAFVALAKLVDARCDEAAWPKLRPSADALKGALKELKQLVHGAALGQNANRIEANARELLMSTGRVVIGASLLEHAQWSTLESDRAALEKWIGEKDLVSRALFETGERADAALALDLDSEGSPRGCGEVDPNGSPRCKL